MWTCEEIKTKESIENFARKSLESDLQKWWKDQEANKSKNKDFKIVPFLIWSKRCKN